MSSDSFLDSIARRVVQKRTLDGESRRQHEALVRSSKARKRRERRDARPVQSAVHRVRTQHLRAKKHERDALARLLTIEPVRDALLTKCDIATLYVLRDMYLLRDLTAKLMFRIAFGRNLPPFVDLRSIRRRVLVEAFHRYLRMQTEYCAEFLVYVLKQFDRPVHKYIREVVRLFRHYGDHTRASCCLKMLPREMRSFYWLAE